MRHKRLFGLLPQEGDEVVSVLGLLEAAKGHLCAGNVLLGVLEVLELYVWLSIKVHYLLVEDVSAYQCPFRPRDAL
jgi:hypothetical protein